MTEQATYNTLKYIFAIVTGLLLLILITHEIDNEAFSEWLSLKDDVYRPIFGIAILFSFCGFGYCWAIDIRLRGK